MKPLYHPALKDVTVEGLLYALSDPVRVRIYAEIAKAECPQMCSTFLEMGEKTLPKSTLSQHFRILRESGLIRSERHGVKMHNVTRCEELKKPFGKMIGGIIEAYLTQGKKPARKKA
jgi:DNA-binding transcriptional ArsR family regulator